MSSDPDSYWVVEEPWSEDLSDCRARCALLEAALEALVRAPYDCKALCGGSVYMAAWSNANKILRADAVADEQEAK